MASGYFCFRENKEGSRKCEVSYYGAGGGSTEIRYTFCEVVGSTGGQWNECIIRFL